MRVYWRVVTVGAIGLIAIVIALPGNTDRQVIQVYGNAQPVIEAPQREISAVIDVETTMDQNESSPGQSWNDYWSAEESRNIERNEVFLNAIGEYDGVVEVVLRDYVLLKNTICKNDISMDLVSKSDESPLYAFLMGIKASGGDKAFYEKVINTAKNSANCDDEAVWINDTLNIMRQ